MIVLLIIHQLITYLVTVPGSHSHHDLYLLNKLHCFVLFCFQDVNRDTRDQEEFMIGHLKETILAVLEASLDILTRFKLLLPF